MRAPTRTIALAAGLVLLSACGSGPATGNPFIESLDGQIAIRVDNRNFNDATVYAIVPGSQKRLGVVTGKTGASYRLDWARDEVIRLRVQLLAGQSFTTQGLRVRPGEQLQLIIDPILARTLIRN